METADFLLVLIGIDLALLVILVKLASHFPLYFIVELFLEPTLLVVECLLDCLIELAFVLLVALRVQSLQVRHFTTHNI